MAVPHRFALSIYVLEGRHHQPELRHTLEVGKELAAAAAPAGGGTPLPNSPSLARSHGPSNPRPVMCVRLFQCALTNLFQYIIASNLLHSRFRSVKVLRLLVGAPSSTKVETLGSPLLHLDGVCESSASLSIRRSFL